MRSLRVTSFGQLRYPAGGPYYPTDYAAANGLAGSLLISFRATELGARTTYNHKRHAALSCWAPRAGPPAGTTTSLRSTTANQQENAYSGSFVYANRIVPAIATGLINPWGPSGPEGSALLASTAYSGTPQTADGTTSLVNAFASREIARTCRPARWRLRSAPRRDASDCPTTGIRKCWPAIRRSAIS